MQDCPGAAQAVHVEPFVPQETGDCCEKAWQVLPEQHPAHEKKSQAAVGMQAPLEQELFNGHAAQACPPDPHWDAFWPPNGTQRLPWQQPLGHVVGEHIAMA